MKLNENEIEKLLQSAPQPQAPGSLRKQLLSQVSLPESSRNAQAASPMAGNSWLRRWWPALAPATLSLACGVVMAVQSVEITGLKNSLRESTPNTAAPLGSVPSSHGTKANPSPAGD